MGDHGSVMSFQGRGLAFSFCCRVNGVSKDWWRMCVLSCLIHSAFSMHLGWIRSVFSWFADIAVG